MSHLDDLDEYEAELELRIKKEYAAVFGLYDGQELLEHWRVATEAQRTGDELGALVGRFIDLSTVDGVCLSSTVPALVREYEGFAARWAKAEILVVGPGVRTGIPIRH